jgi:hypothetical protein
MCVDTQAHDGRACVLMPSRISLDTEAHLSLYMRGCVGVDTRGCSLRPHALVVEGRGCMLIRACVCDAGAA